MTFFEWGKKHAENLGKNFNDLNFESPYDLNTEITYPPNKDQVHFAMLLNKHIQNN